MNYYNEWEPKTAQWLRNLIAADLIPKGEVDERSIKEVTPQDLRSFTQCHFFAGFGGWPLALRAAGWPDTRAIWTGSCPCQPFSTAGLHHGTADPRHLWPDLHRLIRTLRPAVVMGEQVAAKAGYGWFDGVQADLEAEDYAARAVDIPACSVNAPHIRNRLFWAAADLRVDHAAGVRRGARVPPSPLPSAVGAARRCGHGRRRHGKAGSAEGLADAHLAELRFESPAGKQPQPLRHAGYRLGDRGAWAEFALVGPDADGNYRRVGFAERPVRRLADGRSRSRSSPRAMPLITEDKDRVVKLKALGNGMVLPLVVEVIRAWMEGDRSGS